eukprot:CAMPEP_0180212574 /NCGR_PEP_ID=MMETSP0987-20121128/13576_1 /TAXON_ID=697907 /ORGANISM="non described non described, Strain CCMP2293" /LENGTH=525 /DNA_ID=CAMNT_0022170257 /DNA_START=153 /DNA_END=1732 /DNA_ORIENTATION=+
MSDASQAGEVFLGAPEHFKDWWNGFKAGLSEKNAHLLMFSHRVEADQPGVTPEEKDFGYGLAASAETIWLSKILSTTDYKSWTKGQEIEHELQQLELQQLELQASAVTSDEKHYKDDEPAAADAASAKIAQDLQQTLVDKAGVQFTREKYVIGQIMLKINAYCNEMEDTSVDIAHMSCPFPDAMLRLDDICTCKGGFSGPDVTGPCETCADDEYCFSTGKGKCVENAELVHDHSKCICSVGYSGTDNAGPCTKCEEGHMCPGGDFEPDQCPTGKIPNADHTECVIKPGFYADAEDTSELAALSCTAGKVCVGGAGGAAAQCLADSEPNEDQTACVCNPGYSGADNAACAACPSGSICAGGAAAPVACGANSDPSGDKSECECKAGFYGPNGGTCATCPNGYLCLGGTNADSCPNMARAINGGRGCECVNGAVGDGRTCHNCPANHICAGGNSPARLCTGDGRTPVHRHAGMRCGCLGYWKGADTDANGGGPDCLRKTFGELIAGGITSRRARSTGARSETLILNP